MLMYLSGRNSEKKERYVKFLFINKKIKHFLKVNNKKGKVI